MTSFIRTSVRVLWETAVDQYRAKLLLLLLVLWFSYIMCKTLFKIQKTLSKHKLKNKKKRLQIN